MFHIFSELNPTFVNTVVDVFHEELVVELFHQYLLLLILLVLVLIGDIRIGPLGLILFRNRLLRTDGNNRIFVSLGYGYLRNVRFKRYTLVIIDDTILLDSIRMINLLLFIYFFIAGLRLVLYDGEVGILFFFFLNYLYTFATDPVRLLRTIYGLPQLTDTN